MNWTPDQVAAAERRIAGHMNPNLTKIADAVTKVFDVKPTPRGMNRWESLYRDDLEMRRLAGEIIWYEFEPMRLKLASFTQDGKQGRTIWYTPDFAVAEEEGLLSFVEVKGHWREAARVRIKLAASKYPFRFVAVTRREGAWLCEVFRQ